VTKLSILICTLPGSYRAWKTSTFLIDSLVNQAANKPVEVLYLGDNKSLTVGQKRNLLLNIAKGERVIFVDDDDQISDDYVDKVLSYCDLDFDCVGIGVRYTQNGKNEKIYDYSFNKNINFRNGSKSIAGRCPNHLCLWRREIANRVKFPDMSLGEDHQWADEQLLKGYSLTIKDEVIYHYKFDRANTQTRIRR
jgi:hypothetical protein